MRAIWKRRQRNRPSPLVLVVAYPRDGSYRATVCGPVGDEPPVLGELDLGQVERLCAAALGEPNRHTAVRLLARALPEVESELPGVLNVGMFSSHELRAGVPERPDWPEACERGQGLLGARGRELVERLGFEVEEHTVTASVLRVSGTKRAVAVFLQEQEGFEESADRFQASSPVSHALAVADREGLPWVVLTRGSQIRVYGVKPDVGVGRKGRAETFIELNLALLPDDKAGYLPLLAGANALTGGGTFEEILDRSRDYAAGLGERLRDRVYVDAVPTLAQALAKRQENTGEAHDELEAVYEQAMIVLFRLLFVAYAEDKDLLPYRTNGRYQHHALKTLARDLAEHRIAGRARFDEHATDFWDQVTGLWAAVDQGNDDWGVPAYDGGLFTNDSTVNQAAAALANVVLTNAEIGPALDALLVDEGPDGVIGPVDFRSLSVREFGTIYEGLLESQLSIAQTDLTVDADGAYVPAGAADVVDVEAGEVYFHNRSGERKATGSYFTKPFAVEHLLDHALEPALDEHLVRLQQLVEAGDEAAAANAYFDFRCVDLAMGSGHFLVAAVDRIEARLSAFLALHPIPTVTAELERLKTAALRRLGPLADGVEIEQVSLLRRQVARRCVYGVDRNAIAVELARLGLWIHTFVPGLPLSFLDHNLRPGDSLTGIGTVDEAVTVLDPAGPDHTISVFETQIQEFLDRARSHLRRLATITETTPADIEEARAAHRQATEAVTPLQNLFDLIVTARIGQAATPTEVTDEAIATHPDLPTAREWGQWCHALHFPYAFPEVFLRDQPGFDCIIGNPPWQEATVEKLAFWALRFPGLRGRQVAEQEVDVARLERERKDLVEEYAHQVQEAEWLRRLLLAGPYTGMGKGDPDLYKAFCWRFWQLARRGGRIGVVLPRSALFVSGSQPWREAVLNEGSFEDVTQLLNTKEWVFDKVHPQYSIGLITIRKGREEVPMVRTRGPYSSLAAYRRGMDDKPVEFPAEEFRGWTATASFPLLPTADAGEIFVKLRAHPRLDDQCHAWQALPVAELHATNDKPHMELDASGEGLWPVYKGASFDLWERDTGIYYAWVDPDYISGVLQERRLRQERNRRSAFSRFPRSWAEDPRTLPCRKPRIAFRDVTNRLNYRTTIANLVPPHVVLTNKAPYLVWPQGDLRDEAFLLGVLSSYPLDWYARRVVERSMNSYLFNSLPIPTAPPDLHDRVVTITGRLAAVDDRYADWASAVGVEVGSVRDSERPDLLAELDAAVAVLYRLTEPEVRTIFETFHEGWDASERLERVLAHYRELAS